MNDRILVQRALDLLQDAQYLTDEAGRKLCPVAASADVWTETNQLCIEIKRHWHRVHQWHETQLREHRP